MIQEHERYCLLNENNPDVARVARKAKNWMVVWDRKEECFLLCDEMLHNIFYIEKTLEGIEQFLDEQQ